MADVGLWIDWSGDGFGETAYDDLTSYLIRATTVGGATPEITGASQAGSATFVLQNPDGLFDPDNASSPLYGLLRDGPRVWWGANTDGTLEAGRTVRGRWAGRIVEISPVPVAGAGTSTPTVEIVCEDPFSWYSRVPVALTSDASPANPTTESSFTFGLNDAGSTIAVFEVVPAPGTTLSLIDTDGVLTSGAFTAGGPITGTGMAFAGGIKKSGSFGSTGAGWTAYDVANSAIFIAYNRAIGGDLPDPATGSPTDWNGGFATLSPGSIRQSAYGTAPAGDGIFLSFPSYAGSVPADHTEVALALQPLVGSWIVVIHSWGGNYSDDLAPVPSGWVKDYSGYGGTVTYNSEYRIAHHVVGA